MQAKKFPNISAVCVYTGYNIEYIKDIGLSGAWKMSYQRATKYNKIIIVCSDNQLGKSYISPLTGLNIWPDDEQKGKYLIADIEEVLSISDFKKMYHDKKAHYKTKELQDNFSMWSKNFLIEENSANDRLVFTIKKETIIEGKFNNEFKGLSNPVFYLDKHFTEKQLENLDISNLKISNLLNFNNINIDFAKGINLFIGENNVGKTGLIKFLYANIKSYEEYSKLKNSPSERSFKELLSVKLQNTFQSDDKIGSIVCKSNNEDLNSDLTVNNYDKIQFSFKKTTKLEVSNLEFPEISKKSLLSKRFNTVFIPAKEVLSISKIIKLAKDRYSMPGFDDTYNDLIDDIEPHFVKKHEIKDLENISNKFKNNIIDGEIEYDFDKSKYYYQGTDGYNYDLTMTAEGIKQLGIIPLLIKTGKIKKGTILFLDEPDNNLNPVAIRKFVYALFDLACAGIQIFITTHNHLFSQYISLLNEYKSISENINIPDSKFFALFKDNNKKTSIEIGNDLLDIQHNLILDEHVKLSDKEQEFISKSENL